VRSVTWSREAAIGRTRRDIWRYVTQAARTDDDVVLEAAALLQMPASEIRTLAQIHFILSDEVGELLDQLPTLLRRLTTTTARRRETSAERVRGSIVWNETFAARATGLPHVFVTAPSERAYDTAENRLLVFVLARIAETGRRTGWHRSAAEGAGAEVRRRVSETDRWRASRALTDIAPTPPTPAAVTRVRSGRRRRDYRSAVDAYALYQRYLRRVRRDAIQDAVENHALVTSRDPVLLELLCAFALVKTLRKHGWLGSTAGLVRPPLLFRGHREHASVDVFYQHPPPQLRAGSVYRTIQKEHAFAFARHLVPDLVLRVKTGDKEQWVLVEVKGIERSVEDSARAAINDLLAYRRAFEPVLGKQTDAYGIGIAWGAELEPKGTDEIVLCSPDTIPGALSVLGL
jgi:hypothetical protein